MKKFISLFLVFSLIITPFEGVLALSSSSTSVKDRINTFRSGSDLPIIDISESKSSKVRSEKTSNAYLPEVKSEGFTLNYHIGRNMMIRRGKSSAETTLTYFNEKKQPSVQVDPIFATFHTYDSQGRLTEKTKVDSLDAIWDPSTQIFKKPQILNSKATRVKWDYATSTSHQIRLRQEFIGNSTHPSKVVTYRYLSDDLRSINNFSGNKRKQLELIQRQVGIFSDLDTSRLTDQLISSISISNENGIATQNDFYYDGLFILQFIHEQKKGGDRYVYLSHVANSPELIAQINKVYSNVEPSGVLDISDYKASGFFTQINPILFIDADGSIVDDIDKIVALQHSQISHLNPANRLANASYTFSSADGCGVYMSCDIPSSISSDYYPQYNYYGLYSENQYIPAENQCKESPEVLSLNHLKNEPQEAQAESLLTLMYDLTGDKLGDFLYGAGEELIMFGIYGVVGAALGGIVALVTTIVKRAGFKGFLKLCSKLVPYAGWGMAAYAIADALTFYPDRIGNCIDGDFKECGRLTVDIIATFVGLGIISKSVNVKGLTSQGKEGLKKFLTSLQKGDKESKEGVLKAVRQATGKTDDEILTLLKDLDDAEVDRLLNDEGGLRKFVKNAPVILEGQQLIRGKVFTKHALERISQSSRKATIDDVFDALNKGSRFSDSQGDTIRYILNPGNSNGFTVVTDKFSKTIITVFPTGKYNNARFIPLK